MKKYIFLFNTKFETVVSAKNGGSDTNIELYNTLMDLTKQNIDLASEKSLYKIESYDLAPVLKKLEIELFLLLKQRECSEPSSNQTNWKSRFTEEQMFQTKKIFGIEYKLFTGGIDHKIFWFACLYELIEHCLKNKIDIYVFFNDKIPNIKRLQRILIRLENKNLNKSK